MIRKVCKRWYALFLCAYLFLCLCSCHHHYLTLLVDCFLFQSFWSSIDWCLTTDHFYGGKCRNYIVSLSIWIRHYQTITSLFLPWCYSIVSLLLVDVVATHCFVVNCWLIQIIDFTWLQCLNVLIKLSIDDDYDDNDILRVPFILHVYAISSIDTGMICTFNKFLPMELYIFY